MLHIQQGAISQGNVWLGFGEFGEAEFLEFMLYESIGVTITTLYIQLLQKLLNAAARSIFRIPKFEHISSALSHLHWLPVNYRVHFKILLLERVLLGYSGIKYIPEWKSRHSGMRIAPKQTLTRIIPFILIPD